MEEPARSPLVRSFERHLRAQNRSERTVATYLIALRQADAFLRAHRTTIEAASRADLEAFLADLLARRAPSTAATYYKVLKLLYAWLAEEEEIPADPMRRMKPPIVPDKPVPIVPEDGLKRLFRACAGNSFEARRDTALLMLLLDTGARRDEMAGLRLADVDLELDVLLVLGKGRRERTLPFGRTAGVALDRYLRVRSRHKDADQPWLWLGKRGRLTEWGLVMMLRRRGAQAGLPGCIRTSSGIHSRTSGSPRAVPRLISCGSPAGSPAPCSSATVHRPLTLVPARRIGASRPLIGCRCAREPWLSKVSFHELLRGGDNPGS